MTRSDRYGHPTPDPRTPYHRRTPDGAPLPDADEGTVPVHAAQAEKDPGSAAPAGTQRGSTRHR
jgi:hypothetical protein